MKAGLTGADLARHFGVSNAAVSLWLNRKNPIPDRFKHEFAALIGVDVSEIILRETPNTARR